MARRTSSEYIAKRGGRKVAPPKRSHPMVKRLFEIMAEEDMMLVDLVERSGVAKSTFKNWRTRTVPRIDQLEACFNVLGYTLKLQRKWD